MLNHSKTSKCIVVTGMHRSGTSALMGVLHRLGVDLGSNYLNPSDDNPRGFFENYTIVQINENILKSFNSSWDDIFPLPDEWWKQEHVQQYKQEIVEIVRQQMGDKALFGIKDPRISRLFPLWSIIFGELSVEPCFVIPLRNPLEVADSLKKRNAFPLEKSLLLWMAYMLDAERYSRTHPRVFVSFDEFLRDPEATVGCLSRTFDADFSVAYADVAKEIGNFLEPGLKHHKVVVPGKADFPVHYILHYYQVLLGLTLRENIRAAELVSIYAARQKFLEAYGFFYYGGMPALVRSTDRLSRERDAAIAARDAAVKEREILSGTLDAIYSSNIWKLATLYYKTRDSMFITRNMYKAVKMIVDKGPGVFLVELGRKVREGIARLYGKIAPLPPPVDKTDFGSVKNTGTYDVFFFPMIDFRFRYQRPQQLASYFAKKGHRVFYLNISEFLPLDSENDFKVEVIKENVYEVFLKSASLNMYGGRIGWNALKTIYRSLDTLRKRLRLITAVAIVHNPFWTPLVLRMRKYHRWRVVYDCLDDWSIFDGLGYPVFAHELLLARKADFLAVTAELLHDKWKEYNADCVVVRNACDYDHFLKAAPNSLLSDVKRPVIGFFGGIANWIDIELIHFAATQRNDWSFVLLGDIYTDVSQLQGLPNVSLPGGKPYELMPDYLYDFDVCMIPFKKNKVTEAVDPVKLYEFFSLGKPVVARDLHEIRQYQDLIYLFNTREEFMACIEKALNEKDDEIRAKRRKVAAANTWEERVLGIDNKIREKYRKVSIIVVTYNNLEYNKLCMESILSKTDYPVYEIIVVDNNSSDGTPDYLRGKANGHPFIKLILNDENAGFARANNQGIKESTGNYIVLLNNDTIVTAGWLTKFVNYLDNHSDIGLIGPVTNFCGNEAKIEANYKDLEEIDAFAYQVSAKHEGAFFDIKMLALFCAAMRREIVEKVGSLDESFGVGMFEDDDYSHRVKLKGYRVVCAEDIFIHHFGQGAFKKLIETGEYDDIFTRNKALFEKKWGVPWEPHQFRKSDGIK